uniref:G_PROTEIN_RECEP_F1_2 domain-containing protein n=1 Tax=Steinernema glaseri TaxID=37863 RepID=A0A1I7Y645_9BILA
MSAALNTVMDVSSCVNVPVKLFCAYVIFRHTPSKMKSISMFILNAAFWNLICCIFGTFLHPYPLFPAECLRITPVIPLAGEVPSHCVFFLAGLSALNSAVASSLPFPYRYVAVAHPMFFKRVKNHWVVLFCVAIHLGFSCIGFGFLTCVLTYNDYASAWNAAEGTRVICFDASHFTKLFIEIPPMITVVAITAMCVIFSVLLKRHLKRATECRAKIDFNRQLLRYLLVVTAVPVFLGAIPLLIVMLSWSFPTYEYARELFIVNVVLLCNHGLFFSIASIATLKPYRQAVRGMVVAALGKIPLHLIH